MSEFVVIDRSPEFLMALHAKIEAGVARAAMDIHRAAVMRAPHKTGALWGSFRSEPNSSVTGVSYTVSANTPYARRWEFNEGLTDSLGRHYGPAHFTTGGSSYMRDAARTVLAVFATGKYFV